ncbi:MAG: hypothetical protein KDA83_13110 [Planctomycetales bacterium]|nr:hypothetical protein [Planctomycetales bacterium]
MKREACPIGHRLHRARLAFRMRGALVSGIALCGSWISVVQAQEPTVLDGAPVQAEASSGLEAEATWRWAAPLVVRDRLIDLAAERGISPEQGADLDTLWQAATEGLPNEELVPLVARSLGVIYPEAKPWSDLYLGQTAFPPGDWTGSLAQLGIDPWADAQLRTIVGLAAVRDGWYDEANVVLAPVSTDDSIAPAALLFHRAIARQQLLLKDEATEDLNRLLEKPEELPRRYRDVALLMLSDLESLEPDSLDEVARLMNDVRRRIDRHHSGRRVLNQEEDVIKKLDKLIEELEQQQQQQQMASTLSPSSPAPDSVLKGGPAPGEVDERPQGSGADWGNLPPRERAAAMADLAQDLPSHYRELIEEYFRKLADESGSGDQD